MSEYSIALEKQLEYARQLAHWIPELSPHGKRLPTAAERAVLRSALTKGECFYLATNLGDLVLAAARQPQILRAVLIPPILPSPYGFVYIAGSRLTMFFDDDGDPLEMFDAVLWGSWPDTGGIYVMALGSYAGTYGVAAYVGWDFGETLAHAVDRVTYEPDAAWLRIAAALFLFLAQEILIANPERATRATRRRAAVTGLGPMAMVRVVKLRRLRQATQLEGGCDAHWSCQWLVRGHWRQQWYPKHQRHQPRWIAPYVKGPEDKPLKPPRATVFAVVR